MVCEAILGGACIRHGAFIRRERLIQSLHLRGGRLLDTRRLFESGRLLHHLRYFITISSKFRAIQICRQGLKNKRSEIFENLFLRFEECV